MTDDSGLPTKERGHVPTMLDLVRLSPRPLFPPGGRELFRQIALLTDMQPDQEVLVAACGPGMALEYFVREFQVHGTGADPDPVMIERVEARAREGELRERLQAQVAPLDRLPFRDGVFDVAVGELGLTARARPEAAVRELVRVTRPGGRVALVQLVLKGLVEPERQQAMAGTLGARPLMLVEWKRFLRGAGVAQLHTEDWSDEETAFRPLVKKPFPDFAELFSVPEKLGILRRAWSRWGWIGVRAAMTREQAVHRLLTRERVLGLDLVVGRKEATTEPPDHSGRTDGAGSESPDA